MSSSRSDPASGTAAPSSSVLLSVLMWLGTITAIPVHGMLVLYVRSFDSRREPSRVHDDRSLIRDRKVRDMGLAAVAGAEAANKPESMLVPPHSH